MLKWRHELTNTTTTSHTDRPTTAGAICQSLTGERVDSKMASPVPDVAEVSSATRRSSSPADSPQDSSLRNEAASTANRISSSSSAVSSNELNFEWSEVEEPISSFEDDNNKLPCVARLERTNFLLPGLRPYGEQPLLMFRRVRRREARVRTIFHDKGGAYYEVGQTILIPDDYTGWFELVPPDFRRASCFRSIAEVSNVMPRKFFTRSNLKAVRIEQGEDGEQKFLERKVKAGSFLRTVDIFTARWKTCAQTGLFKKKQTEFVTQEIKYLKCLDTDEKEILVPLSHKGKFNAIYEKGKLNQHSVYTMKDILSDLKLPVKVRLLYGKAPVVPCIFTGMLSVRHVQTGDVILASTILNRRNILLQVPVTVETDDEYAHMWKERDPMCRKEMALRQATRESDFADLPSFVDAQKLCKKYALMFSTLMKLAPEQDTNQKTIQHMPTVPDSRMRSDDALQALDLITDISLTDDADGSEPRDVFMGESDSDSVQSEDQQLVMPTGSFMEFSLFPGGGPADTHA